MNKIFDRKKPTIWAIIMVCAFVLAVGGFKAAVNSQTAPTAAAKKDLPIYCVDTQGKKQVAISFDAAWGADDTDALLDILKRNNVNATFFLCGYWVDKYPEEVKKIYEAGNDIGNHSNTHPHSSKLSIEQNKENIMACHEKVKNLLGIDMNLYRPPFGEYNSTVLNAAKECGYYSIQWDVEALETKYKNNLYVKTSPFSQHFLD